MNKNTRFRIPATLALVLGVGALQAEPAETEALGFSQSIITKKKEFDTTGRNYGLKAGAAVKSGKPEDLAAAKVAYVDTLIVNAKIEEDWQAIQPPAGKAGKDLHAAFRLFLQRQRQSLQTDGLKLIRIVEDQNLNADEKSKRVLTIVRSNQQPEAEAQAALEKVHKAFREEHKIK